MTLPASGRGQTHFTVGLVVVAALLAVPALLAAQQPGAAAAQPATPAKSAHPARKSGEADKKSATSYSLGVSMGEQLRRAAVTPEMVNTTRLAEGVRDALAGKATLTPADQANIRELVTSAVGTVSDANHHKAAAFLAENGKKTGVVTTASGLGVHGARRPAAASRPRPTDEVTVNYRGDASRRHRVRQLLQAPRAVDLPRLTALSRAGPRRCN